MDNNPSSFEPAGKHVCNWNRRHRRNYLYFHNELRLSAGSVTMTLSNGTTNYTATLAVPQFSASTNGAYIANGIGELDWSSLGGVPAGPGTQMIISGATGSYASFNGTQTILGGGGEGAFADIALAGSAGFGAAVMTTKCYPSVLPYMTFGNDSEAGPPGPVGDL